MFKKCIEFIKDERGVVTTTEMLIAVAISAATGAMVVKNLLPHLKDMHLRVEDSITEVGGSGY